MHKSIMTINYKKYTAVLIFLNISNVLLLQAMEGDVKVSEKPKQNNSAIIATLLQAGAQASKEKSEHIIIMLDESNDYKSQTINFHFGQEQLDKPQRVSACTKITNCFSNLKKSKFSSSTIKDLLYRCLRKPVVLNTVACAPIAIEALGGYGGSLLKNDGDYAEKSSLTILGTCIFVPLIEFLYKKKFIYSRGMVTIMLPLAMCINLGNYALTNEPEQDKGFYMFTLCMLSLSYVLIVWQANPTPYCCLSPYFLYKLIKTPYNIMIYAPITGFKKFLDQKISGYFTKQEMNNHAVLAEFPDFGLIFPKEIREIIEQYAQSEEESAIEGLTKIDKYNSVENAIEILYTIYSYAQPTPLLINELWRNILRN